MTDIRENERMEKELRKMELMEKAFRNGVLDYIFPWHMWLGKFETGIVAQPSDGADEQGDFAYTPFKTFNRRRNFLVWLHSRKFDHLYTAEERQKIHEIESQ